jgi:peptide-methionine (S)-S-oxide reductase
MRGWIVLLIVLVLVAGGVWATGMFDAAPAQRPLPSGSLPEGRELATVGGGCFWCTEAVFQQVPGVHSVASGYSGGSVKNPTYREVCSKNTGHAEVVQITFDPKVVSYAELLEIFWKTHDPTTLNRQGNDTGPQYRSVVFYHNDEQRRIAEQQKQTLDAAGIFDAPIVTEITAYTEFYPAEDYHQNYYRDNPQRGYCRVIINPKLRKLEKLLKEMQTQY